MNFIILVFIFIFTDLFAQDLSFLTDDKTRTILELDQSLSPSERYENSSRESKVNISNLALAHTMRKNMKSVTASYRSQKLDLSENDFYNIQGSLAYRQMNEEGNFWSFGASFGAASDRPFKNGRDNTLSVTYLQKINPRWFGVLNYSNNRPFLNNVPLPGFFWIKEMSAEKTFIIGFPFLVWTHPLGSRLSFRYMGLLPWTHRVRLVYKGDVVWPYLAIEQGPMNFFRHDRDKTNERFFWFERKLGGGFEGKINSLLKYDFFAGLSFDRQFFEARNFSEKKNNLTHLKNSFVTSLNLKFNF